ncbi:MAG: adenylate kinase [Actinobacteria bacterium]|nr:adenylate kinase [Actinomycetota bacterium]MCB9389846.1 adenylate kinase [Acidimicrobiia bacterium]
MAYALKMLISGKQGAGKGTQAAKLADHYGVAHVSTGDMFRAAVKAQTPLGQTAKGFMDRGELVPDDVVIGVVVEFLTNHGDDGFILDGFPRTAAQAEALEEAVGEDGLDLLLDLDVPTDIVVARIAGRRVCSECGATYHVDSPPNVQWVCDVCGGAVVQRDDDTEDAVATRLQAYQEQTKPLLDFYAERDLLVQIDGDGDVDEVFARAVAAIDGARAGS